MAVRKIGTNCRSITGRQGLSGQQFESTLERDLLDLLKFDLTVESYETQPVTIYYDGIDGKHHSYKPDVLVRYRQDLLATELKTPLLIEVKYRDEYREKYCELRPKFRAAIRFAREQSWRFKVLTEREIRTPFLDNARFLCRYREHDTDEFQERLILDCLARQGEMTPKTLVKALSDDEMVCAELLSIFWKLVANFEIGADLTEKLHMHSRVWRQA